jgi:hypothetical protein
LADVAALQSLPPGVDAVVSLCRVNDDDLPVGVEQIDIRLIDDIEPCVSSDGGPSAVVAVDGDHRRLSRGGNYDIVWTETPNYVPAASEQDAVDNYLGPTWAYAIESLDRWSGWEVSLSISVMCARLPAIGRHLLAGRPVCLY